MRFLHVLTRLEHVSGLLVLLVANLGLSDLASEASSHTGVNTSLLSPGSLKYERDVSFCDYCRAELPKKPATRCSALQLQISWGTRTDLGDSLP